MPGTQPTPSCIIAEDGGTIMFLPCGFISFNPNDARERYCVLCHRFMETVIDHALSAAAPPLERGGSVGPPGRPVFKRKKAPAEAGACRANAAALISKKTGGRNEGS